MLSGQWVVRPRLNMHVLSVLVLVENDSHPFGNKALCNLLDGGLRLDRLGVEKHDLAQLRRFERFSANVQSSQDGK